MPKPTQKRIKECFKNININFSELIDAVIYYEKKDIDDWGYEIINYIQRESNELIINSLFEDIVYRTKLDKNNPMYQWNWYVLFNINQSEENTHNLIAQKLKNHKNKEVILEFIELLSKTEDCQGEMNVKKFLNNFN